jgi:hypothetical protein
MQGRFLGLLEVKEAGTGKQPAAAFFSYDVFCKLKIINADVLNRLKH